MAQIRATIPDPFDARRGTCSPETTANPRDRYICLHPDDRIAILSFMCNLVVSSKAIHAHMESCEEQLTALRKEKIEVNRQKKQ